MAFVAMSQRPSAPPELLAKSQEVASAEQSSLTKSGHSPAAGTTHVLAAVGWGRNATRTISSVTYGGNAMTSLVGVNDNTGSGPHCGVAFYIIETSASGDIVFTMSDTCDGLVIWALDLKNVNTSPNHDSDTDITSGTAAKSIALATTRPTLMLGMRCVNRVTSSYTPGSGVTEEYDIQHGPGGTGTYFLGSRVSSVGENFNFGCTVGSTANGDAMAAVALAGR